MVGKEQPEMSIARILSPDIPVLNPTDTVGRALEIMQDNYLRQLPLVADDNYLGLAQEQDLTDLDDETTLGGANIAYKPAIKLGTHVLEALRLMSQMNLTILPVVDIDDKYSGAISQATILHFFSEHSGIENPGGIIVLEIEPRNYSLYQIARICENEDIIVINSQLYTNPNGVMEVTLKTNKSSLDALVSSFERHEYKVIEVHGDPKGREDLMDKYNLLMNYLKM
jgi:acetoin utilization protein AcuB